MGFYIVSLVGKVILNVEYIIAGREIRKVIRPFPEGHTVFIPHTADSFDLIALYEKISSVCGNQSIVPPGTDVIFRFVAMTGFSANTEHNPLHHMGLALL